jgi:hypothetical protein
LESAARTLNLVVIEPQSCFAGAFARFLGVFAPGTLVRTFNSLGDAREALAHADAAIVDLDPGGLDPAALAAEIRRFGGPATIALSSSPAPVRDGEAGGALLGVVAKTQSSAALAREILAVVRGGARPGIVPDGWTDRRIPGGSLPFIGRDRRRFAAC